MKRLFLLLSVSLLFCGAKSADPSPEAFRKPANEYRPMPFWHINGALSKDSIESQMQRAKYSDGFGGVAILPTSNDMTPAYLSDEYFTRYRDMLEYSRKNKMELILYDDIDFPSGWAGGVMLRDYPELTRKVLRKDEYVITGPAVFEQRLPDPETNAVMTITAMNVNTYQLFDLRNHVQEGTVRWEVPLGAWRVMFIGLQPKARTVVDYMDTVAVAKFIEVTYDEYGRRFAPYFGNVIKKVFYDDIGFNGMEKTWTPAITRIFEEQTGRNAALCYPALFYDIGPDSEAIRVAFHTIRSELMAEGYPRMVAEWCEQHDVQSIGHPPGNYTMNTSELHGDILKFYRHTQIPLADNIFYYTYGRNGHKQISSSADLYDRPVVGIEINGAFKADTDSLMLYRSVMDAFARGINYIMPHGMWYDNRPERVHIPPVISSYNPLLGPALPRYSDFVARSCYMLQGGRRVSNIALLYPITSLQGFHKFDIAVYRPWGEHVPAEADFHQLSDLLSNSLRRDFTFVHPESLLDGRVVIDGPQLKLKNPINHQEYDLLLIPGGRVLSVETLRKIKAYYDGGGKILATTLLPEKSAEFGCDSLVQALITEIFGDVRTRDDGRVRHSAGDGMALFVPEPTEHTLLEAMESLQVAADLYTLDPTPRNSAQGVFNCIHKQRGGKDIYFFTNSTDDSFSTPVELRGRLKLQEWNPYTGKVRDLPGVTLIERNGAPYTRFELTMPAVRATFIVGTPAE